MHRHVTTIGASAIALAAMHLLASSQVQAWDYLIEEQTDFTGNGCTGLSDLNDVTASLNTYLTNDGHIGSPRIMNSAVWPQHFMEACSSNYGSGGQDAAYADDNRLAVYAGHGDIGGKLWFGYQKNGRCVVDLGSNMRLGSMQGNATAHAMYITSCTLHTSSLASDANFQWVRQQYGFHNSPSIENGDPGMVYFSTGTVQYNYTNTFSWNGYMEYDMNEDEENSPIVISYGVDAANANLIRDTAKMRANVFMGQRTGEPSCMQGQPAFYYNYVMINNGDCP